MTQRKALGRGLEALLSTGEAEPVSKEALRIPLSTAQVLPQAQPATVPIDKIFPNRSQPRENFDDAGLKDLAASIKEDGMIQPVVVSPSLEGRFELIAGERRLRAARQAGLTEVPVIIRNVEKDKMLELALVENIQREDLNPMEEAKGYQNLQESFGLNHADIAERVGKSREHVANATRLLKLPKGVQEDVAAGRLSAGHARALLALSSGEEQLMFRNRIISQLLSVRDIERMIQEKGGGKKRRAQRKMHLSDQMKLIIDEMEKVLATKVHLQAGVKDGHGKIIIDYYSWQDLDRVYRKIAGPEEGEKKWERTTEVG